MGGYGKMMGEGKRFPAHGLEVLGWGGLMLRKSDIFPIPHRDQEGMGFFRPIAFQAQLLLQNCFNSEDGLESMEPRLNKKTRQN